MSPSRLKIHNCNPNTLQPLNVHLNIVGVGQLIWIVCCNKWHWNCAHKTMSIEQSKTTKIKSTLSLWPAIFIIVFIPSSTSSSTNGLQTLYWDLHRIYVEVVAIALATLLAYAESNITLEGDEAFVIMLPLTPNS